MPEKFFALFGMMDTIVVLSEATAPAGRLLDRRKNLKKPLRWLHLSGFARLYQSLIAFTLSNSSVISLEGAGVSRLTTTMRIRLNRNAGSSS